MSAVPVPACLGSARRTDRARHRAPLDAVGRRTEVHRPERGAVVTLGLVVTGTVLAGALGLLAMTAAAWWRLGAPLWDVRLGPYVPVATFAAATRAGLYLWGRHHRNRRCRGYLDEIAQAVHEATVGSLAVVLFTFFWREGTHFRTFSYSRTVFLADWLFAAIALSALLALNKGALRSMRRRGLNRRTIALVGDSPAARQFAATVGRHPEMGYEIGARLPGRGHGDFVAELARLAQDSRMDAVMLADRTISRTDISRLVGLSQFRNLDVHAVPELFGLPPTKVSAATIGPFPLLSLCQDPIRGVRRAVKRAIDIAGACTGLLLFAPLMLPAALAVRLTSPGPTLFRQERVGMDGRRFRMLKFRTMHHGASSARHCDFVVSLVRGKDEKAPTVKGLNKGLNKLLADPRVTGVGRILRRLSIDELPQLFNVLRGEMSLVGPRPALPYEAAAYEEWHRRRLDVRPGMTGLWQVSGRSKLTYDEMVKLDLTYIETWAPLRDVAILLRTLPAVLRRESG